MKLTKHLTFAAISLLLVLALWLYFTLRAVPYSEVLLLGPEELVAKPHVWKITGRILALLFRPKSLRISADIFSSGKLSGTNVETILQRPAAARRDETMVWLLSGEEMDKLGNQLRLNVTNVISRPKIVVSEFNTGSFFTGIMVNANGTNTSVGLNLEVTPRRKRNSTELKIAFSWTEVETNQPNVLLIRTNASVAARIRAADDQRILVLSERKDQPPVGLLIWSLHAQ